MDSGPAGSTGPERGHPQGQQAHTGGLVQYPREGWIPARVGFLHAKAFYLRVPTSIPTQLCLSDVQTTHGTRPENFQAPCKPSSFSFCADVGQRTPRVFPSCNTFSAPYSPSSHLGAILFSAERHRRLRPASAQDGPQPPTVLSKGAALFPTQKHQAKPVACWSLEMPVSTGSSSDIMRPTEARAGHWGRSVCFSWLSS